MKKKNQSNCLQISEGLACGKWNRLFVIASGRQNSSKSLENVEDRFHYNIRKNLSQCSKVERPALGNRELHISAGCALFANGLEEICALDENYVTDKIFTIL